ncbi:Glycosyltransferase [Gaiella occulta]|uniref:Glycosyltransferase n=1 Tax=Gaiella occulta TaxID=1002870 RepID=A0A7M2Z1G2_9ACTN|nr:glycosyltransferase [Gaiella occulta]RDI76256.1 Glycosyltransferase [Gaiella occulta]
MTAGNHPCALLLTNDPLEAYAAKTGALPEQASLSPAGVFARVVVAYQACAGGRFEPRPRLRVYAVRALRASRPTIFRGCAFAGSLAWFVLRVARIARAERVDLIRAYNPFVQGAVGVLAGRLARRPCVVAVHSDSAEILARLDPSVARVFRLLERFALGRAEQVWCVTEYLRQTAITRGARPERVRVVPNRVAFSSFATADPARVAAVRARYRIPPDAPVVVAVGRLDPEKDPLTLVHAFARLRSPEARLVLVGDGCLHDAACQEAARLELHDRVVVTGFRPRTEIPAFLHLASVYVIASQYEGFPHALVEALAAGLPIVASDIPQLDEILAGTSAARFPTGDAAALAARIQPLLDEPVRARVAAASGQRYARRFERAQVDAAEAARYRELLPADPAGEERR